MAIHTPSNPEAHKGPKGDAGPAGPKGAAGKDSTVVQAKPAGTPADLAALIVILKSTGLLT